MYFHFISKLLDIFPGIEQLKTSGIDPLLDKPVYYLHSSVGMVVRECMQKDALDGSSSFSPS